MIDLFLFGIFPYIALVILIGGSIWRYATKQFTFSSLSSQFLEGRLLFWGSVPWHYGIIVILIGHLIGIFIPSGVMAFNRIPLRLYILEGTALALGLLLMVGLVLLLVRRSTSPRIRRVTSTMDIVLLVALLLQVLSGIGTAVFYRWGSAWFPQTATPYLWSLATFSPKVEYVTSLPLLMQVHTANSFVLLAIFPFTRMVHMLSIPISYLWRPSQIVVWYRRQAR
ncbi:MAG: respiratory nitrate reductase subunit gamma [Dehalococcoidia bacterium]|nr:respiratory nitrate reductase subunit gamma [Dehalococcoidia bacterium]